MGGAARHIRRFSITVGAAALLWLLLPGTSSAAPNTWSGTWQTAWTGGSQGQAEMDLTQDGTTVSGTYDHLSGTIQGTVTADHLDGTWTQNNSSGSLSFVLAADGKSWSGTWTDKVSGGGDWTGTCSAGDCLATAAAASSTTTTTTAKRPTAVAVQCDRDTNNTTNAHFDCRALVNDIGQPAQAQKPTGTVTFTATKGQFLSGSSCALVVPPDVGASSCVVAYDATNEDAQIGTALPVTASYGGDPLFAASSGVHTLFPGPASSGSGGGIPGWAIAAGAAGGVAAAGLGIGWWAHAHGAGSSDDIDSLVTGNLMNGADLLDALGIDPAQFDTALGAMTPLELFAAQQALSQAFANALGIPDPSSVAHMTRAQMESSLQQLNPALTQALGFPDPASISNMTPDEMKAILEGLDSFTRVGPPVPPGAGDVIGGTGMLHKLGFSTNHLDAAVSQMSPSQVGQILQHFRNAFSNAGAAH